MHSESLSLDAGHWTLTWASRCFWIPALTIVLVASGQPEEAGWLDRLGSPDYEQRQEATREILAAEQLDVAGLGELYRQASLEEQRQRLLRIGQHHFLRQLAESIDRGPIAVAAIGVLTRPVVPLRGQRNRTAVRVAQTFPGFPAYTALQAADLIVAIDDQPLPDGLVGEQITKHFAALIQKHAPGQHVTLTVLREGRTMKLSIKMSSLSALTVMYPPAEPLTLNPAYQRQWTSLQSRWMRANPPSTPLAVNMAERIP